MTDGLRLACMLGDGIGPEVVALWSEIMNRVSGSRLILKYQWLGDAGLRKRFLELFAGHGIDAGRLELLGATSHAQQLEQYNRVDLALDTVQFLFAILDGQKCHARRIGEQVPNVERCIASDEACLQRKAGQIVSTSGSRFGRRSRQARTGFRRFPFDNSRRRHFPWHGKSGRDQESLPKQSRPEM